VLLHSRESEKYRDLPFRSPASLEVFEYGRELARRRRGGDGTDLVTFGKGSPHLCLGDLLARTEIRIMFEELIPRLADIRLVSDVPRVRSNFVNGIKKLPEEATLASASRV
jgi:cytochrome P450